MNKYGKKEFLSGILIIFLSLYAANYFRADAASSSLDHFLSIAGIVVAVGVAILMIRRLSEMYFLDNSRTNKMLKKRDKFSEKCWTEHYEAKQTALEKILGPMDDIVGHSIIPFDVGGALDMYYFSSYMPGTVFCSMELIDPDGEGPMPSNIGTYELISCTKHKNTSTTKGPLKERKKRIEEDRITPFEKIHHRMCGVMTATAHYSFEAILNSNETCEIPSDDENDIRCLIFDDFNSDGTAFKVKDKTHGLLLCIEVFRSEMEYAMEHGSDSLLAKLKSANTYPYSDLDRDPVV